MTQSTSQPDLREHGAPRDGTLQTLDTRLFMQFFAFGGCRDPEALADALARSSVEGTLYADINDPTGVGLVACHTDPDFFLSTLRPLLNAPPFDGLTVKAEHTMFGRTYAQGYEPDLHDWILNKPRRTVMNPEWPWAVWYPLRRSGAFVNLSDEEQRAILKEHGGIGRAFGAADYAHDIRLACHGLDKSDNDFVIGLVGKELHPLSAIVQRMRKTKQTSMYLDRLGPFFVGKAIWQASCDA